MEWVQIDEPILSLDLEQPWRDSFAEAYHTLHDGSCRLLLTTYFGTVDHHLTLLKNLPVDGLHIDVSSAPEQLESFLTEDFSGKTLSLGCIDGRNIWRADLSQNWKHCRRLHPDLRVNSGLLRAAPCCIARWIWHWKRNWSRKSKLAGIFRSKAGRNDYTRAWIESR